MATFQKISLVALSAAMLAILSGCTVIGFGIGAGVDAKRKPSGIEKLSATRYGTYVRLVKKNGENVRGIYVRTTKIEAEDSETPDIELVVVASGRGNLIETAVNMSDIRNVTIGRAGAKWGCMMGGCVADMFVIAAIVEALSGPLF